MPIPPGTFRIDISGTSRTSRTVHTVTFSVQEKVTDAVAQLLSAYEDRRPVSSLMPADTYQLTRFGEVQGYRHPLSIVHAIIREGQLTITPELESRLPSGMSGAIADFTEARHRTAGPPATRVSTLTVNQRNI
jgi:hypothetical protein